MCSKTDFLIKAFSSTTEVRMNAIQIDLARLTDDFKALYTEVLNHHTQTRQELQTLQQQAQGLSQVKALAVQQELERYEAFIVETGTTVKAIQLEVVSGQLLTRERLLELQNRMVEAARAWRQRPDTSQRLTAIMAGNA
jgi:hypothetical protein